MRSSHNGSGRRGLSWLARNRGLIPDEEDEDVDDPVNGHQLQQHSPAEEQANIGRTRQDDEEEEKTLKASQSRNRRRNWEEDDEEAEKTLKASQSRNRRRNWEEDEEEEKKTLKASQSRNRRRSEENVEEEKNGQEADSQFIGTNGHTASDKTSSIYQPLQRDSSTLTNESSISNGGRRLDKLQRRFNSSLSFTADSTTTSLDSAATATAADGPNAAVQCPSVAEVKSRSFLHGSVSKDGLLGAHALRSKLPDRQLHLAMFTWNTASVQIQDSDLRELLLPEIMGTLPHMFALCFQECAVDATELMVRCQEIIGATHVLLKFCRNGALLLAVFLHRDLIWFVSLPECDIATTRAALATKGCVAISFCLFGTSILMINSHFKSDLENFHLRLEDYEQTLQKIDLPRLARPKYMSKDVTERFDFTFWAGDLNFRVKTGFGDRERVDRVVHRHDTLLQQDELRMAQAEGRLFAEFHEGDIRFKPTYKFDIGTDDYDTSSKQRVPSYTDRVLFRCRHNRKATVTIYDSINQVKCSDHKPVFAKFCVTLRPGCENTLMSYGKFEQQIYAAGNYRRANYLNQWGASSKSGVCSLL